MASEHPMFKLLSCYFILAICILQTSVAINLRLAAYYTDHMVLQMEPNSAVIWGYVEEAQNVSVTIKGKVYSTEAEKVTYSPSLVWRVVLDPTPPGGPFDITIKSMDIGEVIVLTDVLFGDVWLCSGQSNMAFSVPNAFNASEVLKDSYNHPDIRLLAVTEEESTTPYYDLQSLYNPWSLPTPETLGDVPRAEKFLYFSAVCYLFGVKMNQFLGYPIGLISDNWGGTPVQAWSAPEVIASCPNYKFHNGDKTENVSTHSSYRNVASSGPHNNSVLWNAMIHPLLNFTIKGAIWYQGEANTGEPAYQYACLFPNMIKNWRQEWYEGTGGNTDAAFPFGFVQLCTSNVPFNDTNYPHLRWAQTADYGYVPNPSMENVFMAVAVDLPDPTSPFDAIHPRYKQDVADRLSLGALALAHDKTYIEYEGPFPDQVCSLTSNKIRVNYINGNIKVVSADVFEVCCADVIICRTLEAAWTRVDVISMESSTSLVLGHQCSDTPTLLRYIWQDMPCQFKKCAIYGAISDLPAPPFNLPIDTTCT